MNRFFVRDSNIDLSKNEIIIEGDDYNHIKNVLRLKEGDTISVCDGNENDFIGDISRFEDSSVILEIVDSFRSKGESDIYLKIYQGLPKSDKMELIVQKSTEIGASEVIPMATKRSVVKLSDKKKVDKKLTRWSKIAESASKQSKRGKILKVNRIINLKEALGEIEEDELAIVLYESEELNPFKSVLRGFDGKKISIFIGPEGGFEEEEIELMKESGLKIVSLGNRILRTETAGIVASSIVMYELGDLGVI